MDKESQNISEDIDLDDFDADKADKGGVNRDTRSHTVQD
jgi:hypothetical protein